MEKRYYEGMQNDKKLMIGGVVLILIIIGLAFWYMATHPAPEPVPVNPIGQEPQGQQTGSIVENEQYYEVEAVYPATTPLRASAGAQADTAAVSAMRTFEANAIASFKEQNQLATLTAAEAEMFGLGDERKYALGIDYEMRTSPTTVSYVFMIYEDTLGAHPNGYYRTFTFDLATGKGLLLSELFAPGADYLGILSEKSRASLKNTLDDTPSDMLEAGTTPDEDNFQNFYLDGSVLVIVFAPYQVGPWAIGTQEVRIPKSDLDGVLKARYQ